MSSPTIVPRTNTPETEDVETRHASYPIETNDVITMNAHTSPLETYEIPCEHRHETQRQAKQDLATTKNPPTQNTTQNTSDEQTNRIVNILTWGRESTKHDSADPAPTTRSKDAELPGDKDMTHTTPFSTFSPRN